MHRLIALAAFLPALALAQPPPQPPPGHPGGTSTPADAPVAKPAPLKGDELNKVLYAFGAFLAQRTGIVEAQFSEGELKEFQKGFVDSALGRPLAQKIEEQGPKFQQLMKQKQEEAKEKNKGKAVAEKKKGEEYVAKSMKADPKAKKEASGLVWTELKAGTGPSPTAADTVSVHYKGTLMDGTEFDSSYKRNQPAEFPLGGVIKCWTEGVGKMKVGGKAKLLCPSDIAYGDDGRPPQIPPGATLTFEVELLSIKGK